MRRPLALGFAAPPDELRRTRNLVPRGSNVAGAIFWGTEWEQRGWIKSRKPTWGLRPAG